MTEMREAIARDDEKDDGPFHAAWLLIPALGVAIGFVVGWFFVAAWLVLSVVYYAFTGNDPVAPIGRLVALAFAIPFATVTLLGWGMLVAGLFKRPSPPPSDQSEKEAG